MKLVLYKDHMDIVTETIQDAAYLESLGVASKTLGPLEVEVSLGVHGSDGIKLTLRPGTSVKDKVERELNKLLKLKETNVPGKLPEDELRRLGLHEPQEKMRPASKPELQMTDPEAWLNQ